MESAARDSDEPPTVGVVGTQEDTVERIRAAVSEANAVPLAADATGVGDAAFVVAVGERALGELAGAAVDVPVLAVDVGEGVRSVATADAAAAVTTVLEDRVERTTRRAFAVQVGDERHDAVFDVTLVTTEPARISEYCVAADGAEVGQFRADGVVVATPAGSHGYARAAGGPVVAGTAPVAAVVPIAPFAIDTNHWVVSNEAVVLSVERDEGSVSLLVDGRTVGTVDPAAPVRLSPGHELELLCPPQSQPPW
ncbi:ATP-NAD kinase [Haloarchaeobius litoreus]|uniref:ATP-NAD kinase n=1 Tax=Haloarchaeobius litoreus TaxID=755306 RepID=A0ABD6DGE8_9EURY|nr:ATP-NAD kinase [Haloarchaeobius litoreus]